MLEACPDAQWRLLFALARYGGLRVPSEISGLQWGDIDWAKGRFTVASPKTAHHEGRASRVVPMFSELLPHFEEAFEQAAEGEVYCLPQFRRHGVNLRTGLQRIIQRAGIEPWKKPWHNLRSTRQTELVDMYPSHVVCAWIGNTKAIADKHYLQVTEDHFEKALQIPVQQGAERQRKEAQAAQSNTIGMTLFAAMRGIAAPRTSEGPQPMGDTGLEPVTSSV